jgi:death on curing protein
MAAMPAKMVEHIHDVLVAVLLPFDEVVNPSEHRNIDLIESAVGRPYHTVFGEEAYPTLPQKAAALFHSLACNHCFINGNKRTAVIALDLFVAMNGHMLFMSSGEVYALAKSTVTANVSNRSLDEVMASLAHTISESIIDAQVLTVENLKERLGKNYPHFEEQVARMASLAKTLSESLIQQKKALDDSSHLS